MNLIIRMERKERKMKTHREALKLAISVLISPDTMYIDVVTTCRKI